MHDFSEEKDLQTKPTELPYGPFLPTENQQGAHLRLPLCEVHDPFTKEHERLCIFLRTHTVCIYTYIYIYIDSQ